MERIVPIERLGILSMARTQDRGKGLPHVSVQNDRKFGRHGGRKKQADLYQKGMHGTRARFRIVSLQRDTRLDTRLDPQPV
jgi:hypothetical protein